ncbi:hypothetical protein G6F57_002795 [Rhizopus arrhizus]|uniref:YMC020W-like alpha/beta hydrolase domain-containing protein n=1 Tax=Rhizopus oryzae TaxID=64495 RepID=A0A9P6X7F8_RHIOR|nr:hypothetical protein G6F23_004750 [Rhizopus arrhizus]KAG1417688.1 hypothetical protein G6F58_005396 [Rhizopus delemar]KAG0762201.1 hypothetical protein G6F24_006970 [Rhizopus arrhizus]KAG0790826.1 hypothetical protein G6F21_005527 [Rhizopus arrhizus]KAG0843217.1 hypothetical protein G6F19_000607 [Rhizopus arrhizus]
MTIKRKPEEQEEKTRNDLKGKKRQETDKEQITNGRDDKSIWSWLGYSTEEEKQTKKEEKGEGSDEEEEDSVKVENELDESEKDSVQIENDSPEPSIHKKPWIPFFNPSSTESKEEDAKRQKQGPNFVLPTFESLFVKNKEESVFKKALDAIRNYRRAPSIIESMKQAPDALSEKKIVIVGVHGWFPMKLVRTMIGEPTGTSFKFCEQMRLAVKQYFLLHHQLTLPDHVITTIPLHWEGRVQTRVDTFYQRVQQEWKETLTSADLVLWVTHSQGTPVSVILMDRLIKANILRQPICLLAMAGISHGPFPTLKGNLLVKYFEAEPARELFEFMNSNSEISLAYRNAMTSILENDVKVVLVGSMQDQVVPLYSAIMSGVSHPNLLRAVYIDGHIHHDFLIKLIVFGLHLLNLGLSDHGLLIYLSEVLAGNLYSFENGGHSTIYEELDVFMLSLRYLFETRPLGHLYKKKAILEQQKIKEMNKVKARLDPFQAKAKLNPFYLPWAVRGIWDDPRITNNTSLRSELDELQNLFHQWHPTDNKLKEIKFRLEPLKAKL